MSIYQTQPQRAAMASKQIEQKTQEFLQSGGEITQVAIGESAHNWEIKKHDSDSTRVSWADSANRWTSREAKAASIRQREVKAEEKAARKSASNHARALNERARARRDAMMPRVNTLLEQGTSIRRVAEIVGVTHGTVRNWLKSGAK